MNPKRTTKAIATMKAAGVIALLPLFAGCASWDRMDHADKGTTVGGTGGAVAGALVGGPVGAVVGAGVGAYAGNQVARADAAPAARTTASDERSRDAGLVRSVQQALYDRGYAVGSVDGQWGPATEKAVRQFQQAAGLAASGELEPQTLAALGVR